LGITKSKHYKIAWGFANIGRLAIMLRSSWKTSNTKDSTNGKEPIGAPRIWKPDSSVKKPKGNDIYWFNPYGDQATHFIGYIENPNASNSSYNCKKIGNTSKAGPTMCISSTNNEKTQVGWVVEVGQKARRWTNVNNTPLERSPRHVLNSNEMIVRSLCLETSKKYSGDGHA
jgi:hypothetical protein